MQISEGRTFQAKETGSVKALNQAWQGQERARYQCSWTESEK